jgi:hypothetical protein
LKLCRKLNFVEKPEVASPELWVYMLVYVLREAVFDIGMRTYSKNPGMNFLTGFLADEPTRVARFFGMQYTKTGKNIPNHH